MALPIAGDGAAAARLLLVIGIKLTPFCNLALTEFSKGNLGYKLLDPPPLDRLQTTSSGRKIKNPQA
jgi:hypothetical protein